MPGYLISVIFLLSTLLPQSTDSLLLRTFPLTGKLFHVAPSPFFQGRPYFLELFIDIPPDSLESASIFFKTDSSLQFQALPLEKYRGRFRFRYDPQNLPSNTITYFFTATEKNFGLHATPLDTSGKIVPVTLRLVDPIKYYEARDRER
ncbi:MAG: hypothetical protein V3U24_06395 [Candidatus Neomarinimicrobiota bacterium]